MHTKRIRLLFLLVCFGCLFLCSCGLDDYYVIDPPTATEHIITNEDPTQMYYRFSCYSDSSLASLQISMKGTAIYYKLYKESDRSKLESDISNIKSANSEYSENGINRLKSSSLNYTRMSFGSGSSSTEFLSASGSSNPWEMRVNENLVLSDATGPYKMLSVTPNGGSSIDVYVSKPSEPGEWYINAYAVTVGDVSFQEHYSALAPLGVLRFRVN